MPAVSFGRSSAWQHPGRVATRKADAGRERMIELEFSDYMRSPIFPAGWFVLPSAALGAFLLIALL